MHFEEKKLTVEAMPDLLQCPVSSVEPYAPMLAPVYVYMKLNNKLVSVKAPLDFFTPTELASFKRYEVFYIPKFVESTSRFQTAAKIVKNILQPVNVPGILSPAPFEISNEIVHSLYSCWGRNLRIHPFFAAVFADELCGSLEPEMMVEARETAVVRHDKGILVSGLLIFTLLHLGVLEIEYLAKIRKQVYASIVNRDETWKSPVEDWQVVASDLLVLVEGEKFLDLNELSGFESEWAKKLRGRLKRIGSIPGVQKYESLNIGNDGGVAA